MGREVRRVPADWQHPMAYNEYRRRKEHVPLYEGGQYHERAAEWDEEYSKWQEGFVRDYGGEERWKAREPDDGDRYTDYAGRRPSPDDYMPDWPVEQRTHLMMYEDTSEGTPISPAFATSEELAHWLADNGASSFGSFTATYEQWLPICRGAWAPSMVVTGGAVLSGVEAASAMSAREGHDPKGHGAEPASAAPSGGDAQ